MTEKRKRPERFSTVHNRNNAVIKAVDAQGEEFTGNSPKSIKRLIEFRQDGFREAMDGNGKQMKAMFAWEELKKPVQAAACRGIKGYVKNNL